MSSVCQRKFSTESPSEVTNLQWKIENFKAMLELVEPLKSIQLKFDAGQGINLPTTWKFYFETKDVQHGKLGLFLELLDSPKDYEEVFAVYEVTIKNTNNGVIANCGRKLERFASKTTETKKEKVESGFPNAFGSLSHVLSSGYLVGALVIDIKFELFSFGKTNSSVINAKGESSEMVNKLLEKSKNLVLDDLQKLFEQRNNSDFKIVMKDGKEFPVHKGILSSRSPVFLAMFESDLKEVSSGTVQVDDLSSEAMEIVLKFMYSGNVDENWIEVPEELVYAAEKYSLMHLKEFCDLMLLNAVTPENSIDLLKLARKFNLETAEKELAEYTSQNIKKIINAAILTE